MQTALRNEALTGLSVAHSSIHKAETNTIPTLLNRSAAQVAIGARMGWIKEKAIQIAEYATWESVPAMSIPRRRRPTSARRASTTRTIAASVQMILEMLVVTNGEKQTEPNGSNAGMSFCSE